MRSPRLPILLAVPLAAVVLGGCDVLDDAGPRGSQTREVGTFTRVEADGPVDVHVRVGAPERLEVRAG
jgi:hypothetical protein